MGRKSRISRTKEQVPYYYVFCEGETEIAYLESLRHKFRCRIHLVPVKSKSNINEHEIKNTLRYRSASLHDKIYLMFDLDVDNILDHLKRIKDVTLLTSNPCFEIWLLWHFENHQSEISTQRCLTKLKSHIKGYKKGDIGGEMEEKLMQNMILATERASKFTPHTNPSSLVYLLLNDMGLTSVNES